MSNISRGEIRVSGFDNAEMDFQLIRQLGATHARAASVGECLTIANQIPNGQPADWVNAFEKLGQWQQKDGLQRLSDNHIISGREQLLRASNSYRAAEYYTSCRSDHHQQLGVHACECFTTAVSTMDMHFERHHIPFHAISLPAYFISPQNDGKKRPTLLIVSGFDGTMEEEFLMRGMAGVERGYNVIHFAGPGQMDLFRHYKDTHFEPDFESVVKAVIDYFESREEVDMARLGLLGISIGGYFATRAASHEPRLKALIANSPVLDVHAYFTAFIDSDPAETPDKDDFTLDDLPHIPEEECSAELKARIEQVMVRFGGHSFKHTFEYMKAFKVGDAICEITFPCLAFIGADEGGEPKKQYDEFCKQLKADHYEFSAFEGASTHCQVGNVSFANAVMYDWLDSMWA